ncbi:ABC transporter ATP-binding protein [Bacteriovorax sp. PP10]|uniref:ABC transporter ATP-binding protein n=1 Tax=Bacteriovorax antarcticus TaxID=3088717 RepID=A0ABU5VYL4_9BACT|nr:ABC transporter ATP-binding protein [Bacteriovorax sp. PP10]MEA9358147.1 ABC transporter ATP-binding protein [Bacteriovorax sp. PP10]
MVKKFKSIFKKKNANRILPDQMYLHQTAYLMADDQDESMTGEKGMADTRSLKILYSYARPFRLQILFALSLIFISSILAIYSSKLMGDLLEKGLMIRDMRMSIIYSVAIVLLEIGSIFFIWTGRKRLAVSASQVIFNVRKSLFSKLQDLPMQYYDRQPQGRIVTRVTHDVEGIEEFFTSSLGNLISASMMTMLAVAAMIISNFKLGTVMTLSIIPSLILILKTKDFLRNSNRRVSKFSSAINAKLSEYLNGMETIRSYGLEKWSMTKYAHTCDDYLFAQLKGNMLFAWSMPLVSFCATIPLIGLVWYGGHGVLTGVYSVGLFVSFVRYYERFFNPMMLLSREIHVVQQAFTSTERVMSFLNEPGEDAVLKNNGKMITTSLDGDIKFENVFMQYGEGDWVLKDLNFHIKAGEKIGLVGKTGCGKSSTVALLSRLYEYQSGEVLIDDIPIRNFDRHNLRDKIGFVSQDAIIFKGSLRENLSCEEAQTDQYLIDAAKTTGLVKALAKEGFNLDMDILESGTNLSVGQRQLVSLTRVLLKNPSILILDEATANIDPHYEEIIHEAVMKMMDGRTCLMIAHRLETLKQCDRILVFNQGALVEEGPLSELLSQGNYFYKLHHAQAVH